MAAGAELVRVRDINWTDPTISRAGIVPIVRNRNSDYIWLGLSVTAYSSNIGTIGGGYESDDHDLLDTAIREWNEEVGSNFRKLRPEDVYHLYAFQSDKFIIILLPFQKIMRFKSTEEIHTVIWITPTQLKVMQEHQHTTIPSNQYNRPRNRRQNSGTRAFLFSKELLAVADDLYRLSTQSKVYVSRDPTVDYRFDRPKRQTPQIIPRTVESTDEFVQDLNSGWYATAVIMTPSTIFIYRQNEVLYQLPREDLEVIGSNFRSTGVKILVALNSNVPDAKRLKVNPKNIISVERQLQRTKLYSKLDTFKQSVVEADIRQQGKLIYHYEEEAYKEIERWKKSFNPSRACVLQRLNQINHQLTMSRLPIRYMDLINRMYRMNVGRCPRGITINTILSLCIQTEILLQDPETTIISVPT